MKLFKYLIIIIFTVIIYHLITTGVYSFLMWENVVTLYFGYWEAYARALYLMLITPVIVVVTDLYWEKR
jgi:hypothetical protein